MSYFKAKMHQIRLKEREKNGGGKWGRKLRRVCWGMDAPAPLTRRYTTL